MSERKMDGIENNGTMGRIKEKDKKKKRRRMTSRKKLIIRTTEKVSCGK